MSSLTVHEAALRLTGILDTALPRELGTEQAPARYTVAAVFSRRVSPQEKSLVEQASVRQHLTENGYPGVRLTVDDRRLLIANTDLATLADGLAGEIAAVLRDIDDQITAERIRQASEVHEWRIEEERRAAAVKVEADRVRFE